MSIPNYHFFVYLVYEITGFHLFLICKMVIPIIWYDMWVDHQISGKYLQNTLASIGGTSAHL